MHLNLKKFSLFIQIIELIIVRKGYYVKNNDLKYLKWKKIRK